MTNYKVHTKFLKIDPSTINYCLEVKKYFCELLIKLKKVLCVELLGSANRLTYVRNPKDFDFFLFYESLEDLEIESFKKEVEDLFENIKDKTVLSLIHTEPKNRGFPYVKMLLSFKGRKIDVDIIPTLKDPIEQGCVDRTKKHDQYMTKRLTEEDKIEIRKLKYLLKRHNLYGAESHIKGFSGYACEVLIQKYKKIELIPQDLDNLIDPVDPFRNLLFAVSAQNLRKFLFLKENNFVNPNKYDKDKAKRIDLYFWENAPLKSYYTIKKEKNVIGSVYLSGNIYVEIQPYYSSCKNYPLSYDSKYYRESKNQMVYFSNLKGLLKKHDIGVFLNKYPLFKKVNIEDTKKLKTYYFFK